MSNRTNIEELAKAEVLTWSTEEMEVSTSEHGGPLIVRSREGYILRMYPWYAHPRFGSGGKLWIIDPRFTGRLTTIGEYEVGEWGEVAHDPTYAFLY